MTRLPLASLAAGLAGFGLGTAAAYLTVLRPIVTRWGATAEEARRPLPGDELVPRVKVVLTHAITIAAPPDAVWPWLVQIGCGRAGWYSYDLLDNGGIPSARRILPEFQNLQVGDMVPMTPDGKLAAPVARLEPGRALALGGVMDPATRQSVDVNEPATANYFGGSWAFYLDQVGERATRLLARVRMGWGDSLQNLPFYALEPISFIMQRKMLLGIKERVESQA